MFDIAGPVSAPLLGRALERVRAWHPMLSTRYRRSGATWTAEQQPAEQLGPVLDGSSIPAGEHPDTVAVLIRRTSQALQASLSLTDGRVFAAHLFMRDSGDSHLVLCAHHAVVDAVSWRIVVDDISRLYSVLLRTGTEPAAPLSGSFWEWTQHVRSSAMLATDADLWRALPAALVQQRMGVRFKGNLERHAKTVWLSFTRETTTALLGGLPERFGAPFHHVLLATFLHAQDAHTNGAGQPRLVEVESHGRMTFDDTIDVSRTVGWFTSSYPLALSTAGGELAATVGKVDAALSQVPHLGIAYGVHREALEAEWGGMPAPRLCYNYLGQFEFGDGDALPLCPSTLSPGFARGYDNERIHELRLTARVIDAQLICDLGYSGEQDEPAEMRALVERTAALLIDAAAQAEASAEHAATALRDGALRDKPRFSTFLESGSSAGLLTYRPAGLERSECDLRYRRDQRDRRVYRQVLLSGATGFLGAYVLRELLGATDAVIHCVVRSAKDAQAYARLALAFDWYFPQTPLSGFGARVQVYAGDVTEDRLGLDRERYGRLDRTIDAIYHFAADTRLFAAEPALEKQNIAGTRRLIELAAGIRPKDLHHMSTLAVCGLNQTGERIVFSESTLNVGQHFMNAYEKTKFKAEALVREFVSRGGSGFIYRSGNVSADSRNGRFQRNAADNRFVQTLRAAIKAGELPAQLGEPVALSPVDVVARGIVALSLEPGPCGAVHHVDSPWEVPMTDVFDAIRCLGVNFEATADTTFAELFGRSTFANDRDVVLGYFWATRPDRGVKFDHSRTLGALGKMACSFEPPSGEWLRAFLSHLIEAGALPTQSTLAM